MDLKLKCFGERRGKKRKPHLRVTRKYVHVVGQNEIQVKIEISLSLNPYYSQIMNN